MGEGDGKLLAIGGLWNGLGGLPTCLIWAGLSALVSALIMLRQNCAITGQSAIPFGPHLCLGIWLVWVFGQLTPGS